MASVAPQTAETVKRRLAGLIAQRPVSEARAVAAALLTGGPGCADVAPALAQRKRMAIAGAELIAERLRQ